jgi:hypothetical protein
MRKMLVTIAFLMPPFLMPAQTYLTVGLNASYIDDNLNDQTRPGFGLGMQHKMVKISWFSILMQEDLDIRRIHFSYFQGGLGGGTSKTGNANFINVRLNPQFRFGKNLFGTLGVFYARTLSAKIKSGESYSSSMCAPSLPPGSPPPVCPLPIIQSYATERKKL